MHTQRPLVGVPTQSLHAIEGIPTGLPQSWVMSQRYFIALVEGGSAPIMVPLLEQDPDALRAMYERMDGLFLAGGVDMDPEICGVERHPLCGCTDPPRDRVELRLARWALEDGKPILGVCRGLQVINVARGGCLHQDLEGLYPGSIKHDYFPTQGYARDHLAHDVEVVGATRLGEILGQGRAVVNSMHHQGVDRLGEGLVVTARSRDGLVEALESVDPDHFVLGVQWHPETLTEKDAATRRLFEEYARACVAYRNSRSESEAMA